MLVFATAFIEHEWPVRDAVIQAFNVASTVSRILIPTWHIMAGV